jgi:hypothetical protein
MERWDRFGDRPTHDRWPTPPRISAEPGATEQQWRGIRQSQAHAGLGAGIGRLVRSYPHNAKREAEESASRCLGLARSSTANRNC